MKKQSINNYGNKVLSLKTHFLILRFPVVYFKNKTSIKNNSFMWLINYVWEVIRNLNEPCRCRYRLFSLFIYISFWMYLDSLFTSVLFTILKLLTALVYDYIYINKDDNYVQCNMITTINAHELRS